MCTGYCERLGPTVQGHNSSLIWRAWKLWRATGFSWYIFIFVFFCVCCGRNLLCGVCRRTRRHAGGRSTPPPSIYGACLHFYREKESRVSLPSSTVLLNFVYTILFIRYFNAKLRSYPCMEVFELPTGTAGFDALGAINLPLSPAERALFHHSRDLRFGQVM